MTTSQMLEMFREASERGANFGPDAVRHGNWPIAIFNNNTESRGHFMRALIGWRTGELDPRADLEATVAAAERGVELVRSNDVGPLRAMLHPVPGAYAALLTGAPAPAVFDEFRRYEVWPPPKGLSPDRSLDAALVAALTRNVEPDLAEALAALERRSRTRLLAETFGTYFELARLDPRAAEPAAVLARRAAQLFERRGRNAYYAGGIDYEGGGPDNPYVPDFRLAAIWQARGFPRAAVSQEFAQHLYRP